MFEIDVQDGESKRITLLNGHRRLLVLLQLKGSTEVEDSKTGDRYVARLVDDEIRFFDGAGNFAGSLA